jgi:very-short-patch-repair endonuclease
MLHRVVTLDQANAMGISSRQAYRYAEKGTWLKLQSGIFLTDPNLVDDARWKANLTGLLLHGGTGALVSHRSAAVLHGLEGVTSRELEVTVPLNAKHLPTGAHRTSWVDSHPVIIDGLATTSIVRTLCDLAKVCSADVVEQALESALRGPERWRPDRWKESLLADLRQTVRVNPRKSGTYLLRTVLDRRTDIDRPTGSFVETLLMQAMRRVGIPFVRQPTVHIVDAKASHLDTLFPDFGVVGPLILVEADGLEAHSSQDALGRDLFRQNKLVLGFTIRRYTALQILNNPIGVANEIKTLMVSIEKSRPARISDMSVTYSENEFRVVDLSRDARQEAMNRALRKAS